MPYQLEVSESISESEEKLLLSGLNHNAKLCKGMSPVQSFNVMIKKEGEEVALGGLTAVTLFGCLYVDMLWVDPSIRKLGLGKRLMEEAERIARTRSCKFATVNTMDWEALPFYQKLGYEIEFIRKGFEKDSTMYMLRKPLN